MVKVLVCGRGYSLKYYEPFNKGYDLLCGYNQELKDYTFGLYFYSKSKEENITISKNIISESSINEEFAEDSPFNR